MKEAWTLEVILAINFESNISLALTWSLKNGSFSTIFKIYAEIAILSPILTPQKS